MLFLQDELYEDPELSTRLSNTVLAVKQLIPAAARASTDTYSDLLCALHCNVMTVGAPGYRAAHTKRVPGYWSDVRGGLYTGHGMALFPTVAMFNHSCAPNCHWQGRQGL